MTTDAYQVFEDGSTTYFYSSLFFPKVTRDQVAILYTFVRIIDNLVDAIPQQKAKFYDYWDKYHDSLKGIAINIDFITNYVALTKRFQFPADWTEAFWKSMEMDIIAPIHTTLKSTEKYMYGSAEVIGLMMAKIIGLPPESYHPAQMLGKAMQYANFIRDFSEDQKMHRNYLQVDNQTDFVKKLPLLRERFDQWQSQAQKGYHFIPKKYLVPIKTAAEMYKWTVAKIAKNPEIVFTQKVKPSKLRIIATALKMYLTQ